MDAGRTCSYRNPDCFRECSARASSTPSTVDGGCTEAPHLLEEQYNLEDALVCAQYLSAFIRQADVVKVACVAQVVNVIAPILTRKDRILIQSIYYPFALFSQHAKGVSLHTSVDGPAYKAGARGEVATLDVAACYDGGADRRQPLSPIVMPRPGRMWKSASATDE